MSFCWYWHDLFKSLACCRPAAQLSGAGDCLKQQQQAAGRHQAQQQQAAQGMVMAD
jgi:hypothetical protein